ncbi:hypothetical protein FACS1894182_09130 [Bacteroidia bacterium]|nr:hypothetical protein FACS1894182_09130 [Bacteroidia bacterium]
MKKVIYIFATIVIASCLLTACDNQSNTIMPDTEELGIEKELFVQNEYNLDMRDFALAVSNAMNQSTEFRGLIKKQALSKFDGDYDVLLKHIVDKPVIPHNGAQLRSNNSYTVRDLLEDSYTSNGNHLRSAASSIIDELSAKYPNLQVSIPVLAEDWDESTIPVVAFVPYEYEDYVTPAVAGYNSNGSVVVVDAINPPNKAVIVVGQNERIRAIDPLFPPDEIYPAAPETLTATQTQSGIYLNWIIHVPTSATGYKIYRKGPTDSNYTLYAINNGFLNTTYNDNNIINGATFSYYVIAYNNSNGESAPSNVAAVTAPARPDGPTTFDAIVNTNHEVELRWTTNPDTYIEKLDLYRYILNQTSDYQWYQEFNTSQHDCFDRNIVPGTTIRYKLQVVNPVGISNPLYDIVRIPYRDPSQESDVKVKQISCSDNLEGWLMGSPELTVSVYGVDTDHKTYEVASWTYNMNKCTNWNVPPNEQKLFVWKPNNWYERYTLHVVEEDTGFWGGTELTIRANFGFKKELGKSGVSIDVGVGLESKFKFDGPEDIGSQDLTYYDEVHKILEFKKGEYWCNLTIDE